MDQVLHYFAIYGPYAGLLISAAIEGPVTSFIAGTLVATGVLNPYGAFAILAFKDIVLDTVWYLVGRSAELPYFAIRIARWRSETKLADRILASLERGWREHPIRMMWITKLAYGLSMYLLITAGIAKLPFKKFYFYTLPVTIFQFGGLMTLGYFLGTSVWDNVQNWWFLATAVVLGAIGVYYGIKVLTRAVRKRYVETM